MKTKEFVFGTYRYTYSLFSEDRKSLRLTVFPDLHIELKTPLNATQDKVDAFLKRKWLWLERQLRFFKKYKRKVYKKEYLSGEAFLYLGRQYTLKVQKAKNNRVSLSKGVFLLFTTENPVDGTHNQKILNEWYKSRTLKYFQVRYEKVLLKFSLDAVPNLSVRRMGKRWGSFLNKKHILLNPVMIKAPTECIDYVITHELCHMRHRGHTPKYYSYLKEMCPKWEKVKEKLELLLG